jgi:hypothetical protein
MGHLPADGGVDVFFKHYYRFADYEAGKAYFDIGRKGLRNAPSEFTPPVTYSDFTAIRRRPMLRLRGRKNGRPKSDGPMG